LAFLNFPDTPLNPSLNMLALANGVLLLAAAACGCGRKRRRRSVRWTCSAILAAFSVRSANFKRFSVVVWLPPIA
jgi:hypothetical protein